MDTIIFDDWKLRCDNAFDRRKRDYGIAMAVVGGSFVIALVGMFFCWYAVVAVLLIAPALAVAFFEWLKIKNNHLVIKENAIHITNRFCSEKIYRVKYQSCVLVLQRSFYVRGGGIWLKFYDRNNVLICKYEDMLNRASIYGAKPTEWEKGLYELGIEIVDKGNILKNDRWK